MSDLAILERVEEFLARGLVLKRWWDKAFLTSSFAERFDLARAFNQPDSSFGFFDHVPCNSETLSVMGNFQDMFYDRPRAPVHLATELAGWMRDQIREFVLHYFMRVSSFRQPEASVETGRPATPPYLERLSWCPRENIVRQGFGFSQLYYKRRDTGQIGKFSSAEEFAIIDLREIGPKYEWIVAKVRIFDFNFRFKPLGPDGPEVVFGLNEESYLVLSHDFIVDEDNPSPDLLGEYGLGYAFIRSPTQGLIGYGPGQFEAAIELINFRVRKDGQIGVRMAFVVNRPTRIANVAFDPVDWGFQFADLMSFGMTSRLLAPVKDALGRLPLRVGGFDPVYGFIALANAVTGGQAAQQLCISREQLDKDFLVQHFMQHYVTIVGSLLTWRQIPNWLDAAALPDWVVAGRSS